MSFYPRFFASGALRAVRNAMEAAGGARRVCGASSVKKNHDTLAVCRMQKCTCAAQCVVRVSCGEQFTRHMFGADADRAVGSQSCAVERVCESRWCALSRRGWRWRACDFCREGITRPSRVSRHRHIILKSEIRSMIRQNSNTHRSDRTNMGQTAGR